MPPRSAPKPARSGRATALVEYQNPLTAGERCNQGLRIRANEPPDLDVRKALGEDARERCRQDNVAEEARLREQDAARWMHGRRAPALQNGAASSMIMSGIPSVPA